MQAQAQAQALPLVQVQAHNSMVTQPRPSPSHCCSSWPSQQGTLGNVHAVLALGLQGGPCGGGYLQGQAKQGGATALLRYLPG